MSKIVFYKMRFLDIVKPSLRNFAIVHTHRAMAKRTTTNTTATPSNALFSTDTANKKANYAAAFTPTHTLGF